MALIEVKTSHGEKPDAHCPYSETFELVISSPLLQKLLRPTSRLHHGSKFAVFTKVFNHLVKNIWFISPRRKKYISCTLVGEALR